MKLLKVLGSVLFLLFFVFLQFFAHEAFVDISFRLIGAATCGYLIGTSLVILFLSTVDLIERIRYKKNLKTASYSELNEQLEGFKFWLQSINYSNPPPNTSRPVPYMNPQNGISPLQDDRPKVAPSGGSALLRSPSSNDVELDSPDLNIKSLDVFANGGFQRQKRETIMDGARRDAKEMKDARELKELSDKAKSERLPPPPESLVGAVDGPPHKSVGKAKKAKVTKVKVPPRKKK